MNPYELLLILFIFAMGIIWGLVTGLTIKIRSRPKPERRRDDA